MLLLTGPSGCGKTATVQIIMKSLKADLSEWITPADAGNYLDRGRKYTFNFVNINRFDKTCFFYRGFYKF